MLRKASTIPDVWEVQRVELYLAQLEASCENPERFMELLQLLTYFLTATQVKNALSDDDYAYVKETCHRLLAIISAFDSNHPNVKLDKKTAFQFLTTITHLYKIKA